MIEQGTVNRRIKINSFLIALTLLLTYLTAIFDAVVSINSPSILLALLVISVGLYNNRLRFKVSFVVFTLTVFCFILLSCLIHGSNSAIIPTVIFFLIFGVALTYAATFSFRYDELIKYIYYIFVISSIILLARGYFYSIDLRHTMGISYAMLPGIFMITHLKEIYNNTNKKLWFFLSVIPFVIIVFYFVSISVRGSVLALFLYIIFRTYSSIKNLYSRVFFVVAGTAVSFFTYLSFNWILVQLKYLFSIFGVKIFSLDKMLRYIDNEMILNRRDLLFEIFMVRFSESPLLGHGIGDFYSTTGWMHNLFLQVIDEMGIFYVIPFIILLIYSISELVLTRKYESNYRNILGLFFFLSMPRLMVSDFYWRTVSFWLLIVFIISSNVDSKNQSLKD